MHLVRDNYGILEGIPGAFNITKVTTYVSIKQVFQGEAGGSLRVRGQLGLHTKFQTGLQRERPCLTHGKNKSASIKQNFIIMIIRHEISVEYDNSIY